MLINLRFSLDIDRLYLIVFCFVLEVVVGIAVGQVVNLVLRPRRRAALNTEDVRVKARLLFCFCLFLLWIGSDWTATLVVLAPCLLLTLDLRID